MPFSVLSHSSYALRRTGASCGELTVGEFIHTFGDCHIYRNHLAQVEELLARKPLPLPQLEIVESGALMRGLDGLLQARFENLQLIGYQSHAKIAAPVAV